MVKKKSGGGVDFLLDGLCSGHLCHSAFDGGYAVVSEMRIFKKWLLSDPWRPFWFLQPLGSLEDTKV